MSEEGIDATLRDLHLQRRNIVKALNDMSDRCGTGDGLPRAEMEQGNKKLEPLI